MKEQQVVSRRERYRLATRDEIKAIALQQLAEGGTGALSLNAIGREMGLSGPALYRYFDGRDGLLTALILDAYNDLAADVEEAAEQTATEPVAERLKEISRAARRWALAQPHRYLLLFGTPVPGYHAPASTVTAARRSSRPVQQVLASVEADEEVTVAAQRIDSEFAAWAVETGQPFSGTVLRQSMQWWSRLHGMLSLELCGQFNDIPFNKEEFFDLEVASLLIELAI